MSVTNVSPPLNAGPLAGWTVVCLRPRVDQAAAARAIAARGGVALAMPGVRLVAIRDVGAARTALAAALACDATIFTSPAAVRFAARLQALTPRVAFAVGAGTAAALQRRGVIAMQPAADAMHGDGLLALPALGMAGSVGLVTAPGGRDVLAPTLRERGARVAVAHVYRRLPPRLRDDAVDAVSASSPPRAVLVSSAEALANVIERLPAPARIAFLASHAIVSSERLHAIAHDAGFAHVQRARSPRIDALLDAIPVAMPVTPP